MYQFSSSNALVPDVHEADHPYPTVKNGKYIYAKRLAAFFKCKFTFSGWG